MAARVSQATKEIIGFAQDPLIRVTQTNAEVVSAEADPRIRVTQTNAEVVSAEADPRIRVTQANVEILVWANSKLIWDIVPAEGGDVPAPSVILQAPPPPPVFYFYPSGGGKVLKYKPKGDKSDESLLSLQKRWETYVGRVVGESPGLKGLGRISNGVRWLPVGRHRRPFFRQSSIVTPSPAAGNVIVTSFEVPEGYFGFLSGFWWSYNGTGYVEGSTDIEWRIRLEDRYLDGYGRVRFQMGSPRDPLIITGMLPIRTRQKVDLIVFVRNDSGTIQVGSSRISGGLVGWLYEPEGEEIGGIRW